MTKYSKRASSRNHHLDLFGWHRKQELLHGNPAALRIAKRFGLPLHLAVTIANLAGDLTRAARR